MNPDALRTLLQAMAAAGGTDTSSASAPRADTAERLAVLQRAMQRATSTSSNDSQAEQTRKRFSALHMAVRRFTGGKHGDARALETPLAQCASGGDVDVADSKGRTALYLAVKRRWIAGVHALLEAGADPYRAQHKFHGLTALHMAANCNVSQITYALLEALHARAATQPEPATAVRAYVNQQARCRRAAGETALHLALIGVAHHEASLHSAYLLLARGGASVTLRADCGETPLHVAVRNKGSDAVVLLLQYGADPNAPEHATQIEDVLVMRTESGRVPVFRLAVESNALDIAHMLLAAGARPDPVRLVDRAGAEVALGHLAIHSVCVSGKSRLMQAMIARGTNLHARNNDGLTPLHLAALNGHAKLVRLLLWAGADRNARSFTREQAPAGRRIDETFADMTPLDMAEYRDQHKCVALLRAPPPTPPRSINQVD